MLYVIVKTIITPTHLSLDVTSNFVVFKLFQFVRAPTYTSLRTQREALTRRPWPDYGAAG